MESSTRWLGAKILEPDCPGLNSAFVTYELWDPGQVIHLLGASSFPCVKWAYYSTASLGCPEDSML